MVVTIKITIINKRKKWRKHKQLNRGVPWYVCLYVLVMSRTRFRVNPHSIVAWISRNYLLKFKWRNLKFKRLQLDANPEPLSSKTNTQPFGSGFKSSCMICVCLKFSKFAGNYLDWNLFFNKVAGLQLSICNFKFSYFTLFFQIQIQRSVSGCELILK